MKQQNFNDVVRLQDVYDITKKECDNGKGHTWARNLDLMNFASNSESIMELGVNQGTSLALMMLQNPKKIIGVDIDLNNWNVGAGFKPLAPIAKKYADENNIDLEMIQTDSTDPVSTRNVDMLHIDSLHDPNHLNEELILHNQYIKKYIAFHDIKQGDWALWKVIEKFLKNMTEWKLKVKYNEGKCGHAVIERIN